MENLIILQLIAHILADFQLQSEKWCNSKTEKGFRSCYMYAHAFLTFVLSWTLSLSIDFFFYALSIATLHLLIDALKSFFSKKTNKFNSTIFVADQILHVIIIFLIVYLYTQQHAPKEILNIVSHNTLFGILLFIICLKPSNIIIRTILSSYSLIPDAETGNNSQDLERAGRLIGNIERILVFILVLFGQFEAVGFIIAAKTILRFREGDTKKTEYVLIGTLLSFGIAILCGIIIKEDILSHLLLYCST